MRYEIFFFFSSRRRHTISLCDWSSDVCSSDLEGGWGRAGYVVRDLIERVPDRKLRRYLRDREPRRLARQSARAAHPRVHLDHVVLVALRVDRKLDVGSPGGDSDLTYYA